MKHKITTNYMLGLKGKNQGIRTFTNKKSNSITINPKCAYRELLLDSASTGHATIGLESQQRKKKTVNK